MKLIRRKRTRSGVVLFSVAALALAMTGILYAHWTDTLEAYVQIGTGDLSVEWSAPGTDDDGIIDNDESGSDDPATPAEYDAWGILSSVDPTSHGPGPVSREVKDVAACGASLQEWGLYINADNTYPSYNCTFYTDVTNLGSIPVKAAGFTMEIYAGGYWDGDIWVPGIDVTDSVVSEVEGQLAIPNPDFDEGDDPAFEYQLVLDISEGIRCGTQIDPDESIDVSGWFHIEQGAQQDVFYQFNVYQDFVNWNEWDASFCTPGAVVAGSDGTPIGIADGTPVPLPLP